MNGKNETWKRASECDTGALAKLNSERKSVQFAQLNNEKIPLERISTADDCDVVHNSRTQVREKL